MKIQLFFCIAYVLARTLAEASPSGHEQKDFEVYINVTYSPTASFDRSPPYYQAGTSITLTCMVDGVTEGLFFEWSSDCKGGSCFANGASTQSVPKSYLESKDSGTHTCIVYDSLGCSGNASIAIQVVGAGIYVTGGMQSLPNDGLIIAHAYSKRISEFRCLSGTTRHNVGQLIGTNGLDIVGNSTDPFLVTRGSAYSPGMIHVRNTLTFEEGYDGIYTCKLPDENGAISSVNVGLYRTGVQAPIVSEMEVSVKDSVYTLTCVSTGSPATVVMWTYDETPISSMNSTQYISRKVIIDRRKSTYSNTLEISGSFVDIVGKYTCQVKNQLGVSNKVTREIKGLYITGYEKPIIVNLQRTINCSTHLNVSRMEWILVGIRDDPVEETTSSQSLPLTLSPESVGLDGAMFTCRAVTVGGKVFEETVTIHVKEFANSVAINGSSENSLLAGDTYSFDCIVESDLTPTVRWMDANRTSISNGSEIQIEIPITSGLQTILRLTFSNLKTSLGGIYYCESTIIKPQSIKEASRVIKVKIPSPRVSIIRSPPDDLLYTTTQLTLTCLVEVVQVDNTTAIAVNSAWTSPDSSNDTRNVDTLTNHMLNSSLTIPSLQSSDSGRYTCSFSVTSPSAYVEISDPVSVSTTIRAALKVSIGVTYPSPDQYPHYSPPNFRAASPVTLRCMVEGASGSVEYRWSSTCSSCFASNSYSASISEQFLRSKDTGEHKCTVRDSAGNSGSYTQEMNIVGAGIYVETASYHGGSSSSQPNNSYIDWRDTRSESSSYFALYCCSGNGGASGTIVDSSGYSRSSSYNNYDIRRYYSYESHAGCLRFEATYKCQTRSNSYYSRGRCISYYSNPSSGVYTCNIQDQNGVLQRVNFALMETRTFPTITSFTRVRYRNILTLSCVTTSAPPTSLIWTKNGRTINVDGDMYRMMQTVSSRTSVVFENRLEIVDTPDNFTGTYQCRAGNNYYSTRTSSLTVRGISATASAARLRVGQRATFHCSSDLNPTSITWYENDTVVPSFSGQVSKNPVSSNDEGRVFRCLVESRYGQQERNIIVKTYVPASWATVRLGGYEDTAALHGHNYTLYCTVTVIAGLALPVTMEWLHSNGSAVSNDRIVVHSTTVSRVTTLTMTFAPILTTDGGGYSCQASVNVPWMDEQPPNIAESVHIPVTTQALFQLMMGPVQYCVNWNNEQSRSLEEDIKQSVETAIRDRCDCNFESSAIFSGEFSCQSTTTRVTYRATINGTSDILPAPQLISLIEDWRVKSGTMLYGKFRLRLTDKIKCPLEIESFDDEECGVNQDAFGAGATPEIGDHMHCYKITSVPKNCTL